MSAERRARIARVIEGAARLGQVPDLAAAQRALALEDPHALLAALGACGLPRPLWAAIQREWTEPGEALLSPSGAPLALADFRLEGELGRGGMGAVYRARDRQGRPAALKLCTSLGSGAAARRFEHECRALARLHHPHVVRYLGAGAGPPPWLAMELIEGGDLESRLCDGPLEPALAARLVGEVAGALAYAHAADVVHRDVKPANVLLRPDGRAALGDFGLTRLLDASRFTKTGALIGTVAYMAPEQARGEHLPQSDVWALGATLYHCLTGRPPLEGDSMLELLTLLAAPRFEPPQALNPAVPAELSELCMRCLALDPAARPSAAEVERALTPEGANRARRAARARSRGRRALLALAVSLAILTLVALALREPSPGPPASPDERERAEVAPARPWGAARPLRWSLARGPAPRREPAAAWQGEVADPLRPEALPATLAAEAVRPGRDGRVEVEYALTPATTELIWRRPDSFLAEVLAGQAKLPAVRAGEGGGVRWSTDGRGAAALVGHGRWFGATLAAEVRGDPGVYLTLWSGIRRLPLNAEPRLDAPGLSLHWGGRGEVEVAGRSFEPREGWTWAELRPGGDPPRARYAGEALEASAPIYLRPAPAGFLAAEGGGQLRRVRVEGVCLRPDRPARAVLPAPAPEGAWLEARFRRAGSEEREGGPFLELDGASLELLPSELRLERAGLRQRVPVAGAPREGWLRLRRLAGALRGELWVEGRLVAALERGDPRAGPAAASYGSWGDRADLLDVELEEPAPGAGAAPAELDAQVGAWRAAASAAADLLDLDPGRVAHPRLEPAVGRGLLRQLLAAGAAEALAAPVRADALARAGALALVLGLEDEARGAGRALRALRGELAPTDLTGVLPFGLIELARGYADTAELDARAAGHALLDEVGAGSLAQRNARGWVGLWVERARAIERQGRALTAQALRVAGQERAGIAAAAEEATRRARELFLRARAETARARAAGAEDALQDAEIHLALGEWGEVTRSLEPMPSERLHFWWGWFIRANARAELGREREAAQDLLVALALRRTSQQVHYRLLADLLRRGRIPGVLGAACAAGLAFAREQQPPPPPAGLVPADPEEGALLAYLWLCAGTAPGALPEGDGPAAVLARARAGDRAAHSLLAKVAGQSPVVVALAALDPAVREGLPWPPAPAAR
ncbi:MAG: protein kinase [Planctomycetota bacterium]